MTTKLMSTKTSMIVIALTFFALQKTEATPLMTIDGQIVTHVKHCLFHDRIYESHFFPEARCSFNVNNPHPGEVHYDVMGREIAHDPECFAEQDLPLN